MTVCSPSVARSVLIVTSSDDRRDSTAALRLIADTLGRHGVKVTVFLLRRDASDPTGWPGAIVVDDLRTWEPAARVEQLTSPAVAGRLRGARLRWWLRQADPDIAILDDGLGVRVIEPLRRRPVVVARLNAEEPADRHLRERSVRDPDLVVAPVGMEVDSPAPVLREPRFQRVDRDEASDPAGRRLLRRQLGIPEDAVVVGGWGNDGWLDGPDLFIRCLWALEHRHGIAAHGLWSGDERPDEVERFEEEAKRCGLEGRYHHRPYDLLGETPVEALGADVVLLPSRAPLVPDHVTLAVDSGLTVVTSTAAELDGEGIEVVEHLDLDGAAARLAAALAAPRPRQTPAEVFDLDADRWTRRLLDALAPLGG